MLKMLLAGIAVLFLATGAANAGQYYDFKCEHGVIVHTAHNRLSKYDPKAKDTYDINVEKLRNPNSVRITTDRWGYPSINGKQCKLFQ